MRATVALRSGFGQTAKKMPKFSDRLDLTLEQAGCAIVARLQRGRTIRCGRNVERRDGDHALSICRMVMTHAPNAVDPFHLFSRFIG